MIAIFILTISLMGLMIGASIYSIRLYSRAQEINPKNRKLEEVINDLKSAQKEKEMIQDSINMLQEQKMEAQNIIAKKDDAQTFLDTHEQDINKKKKEIETINEEITELSKKEKEIADQYTEQLEQLNELKKQAVTSETAAAIAQEKLAQAEIEIKEKERTIEDLKKEIDRLNSELAELESKKEAVDRANEDLRRAREQYHEMESKIAAITEDYANTVGKDDVIIKKRWEDLDRPYIIKNKTLKQAEDEEVWLKEFSDNLKDCQIEFNERTIKAFHTGLKVEDNSPLVVLSGISGTGKSLLPQLYSHAIGMNFLTVAVQPRWDSPQDMFGFYNYMQNKFKATEMSRLLWQYDFYNNPETRKNYKQEGELPMNLILLDEMNLARVEYYFSDMLSKLEVRRNILKTDDIERRVAEIEIECGSISSKEFARRLFVNSNNLFVGTMNEDETTQTLSDKVMDRSNVLRFGKPKKLETKPDITRFNKMYSDKEYISFSKWKKYSESRVLSDTDAKKLRRIINEFNGILDTVDRPFAHRVSTAIENYVQAYPGAITDSTSFNNALADQIEMKILPKLNGLEKDEPGVKKALESISQKLPEIDAELSEKFNSIKDNKNATFFAWKGINR